MVGGKAPVVFPLKDCFCFYLDVFTENGFGGKSSKPPHPCMLDAKKPTSDPTVKANNTTVTCPKYY